MLVILDGGHVIAQEGALHPRLLRALLTHQNIVVIHLIVLLIIIVSWRRRFAAAIDHRPRRALRRNLRLLNNTLEGTTMIHIVARAITAVKILSLYRARMDG